MFLYEKKRTLLDHIELSMNIKLLIADEFRHEASGKVTVLGLFADNVVIVKIPPKAEEIPENAPAGIERLSFMVNVSAVPEGSYEFEAQFITPSGAPMGEVMKIGNVEIKEGKSFTTVVVSKPFLVNEGGEYHLAFQVNGVEHQLPFEIRIETQA